MKLFSFWRDTSIKWKMLILGTSGVIVMGLAALLVSLVVSTRVQTKIKAGMLESLTENMHERLIERVAIAESLLGRYQAQAGEQNEAELKEKALAVLRELRFGPEQRDYFWIHSFDSDRPEAPVMVMHPILSRMEGSSLHDFHDKERFEELVLDGIPLSREDPRFREIPSTNLFIGMNRLVRERGHGFISYFWSKPGQDESRAYRKTSYVKLFAPWGWVVGSGAYQDEFSTAMKQTVSGTAAVFVAANRLEIGLLLVFLALVALAAILFSVGLTRPLSQASRVAEEFSRGNLQARIEYRGRDEIGVLASCLNETAEKLEQDIKARELAESAVNESQARMLAIFDAIDEPVYVADTSTYEFLFGNRSLLNNFGPPGGKKCYEYLQNLDKPCDFCSNDKILGEYAGRSYVWEFQNQVNRRWYRCIDKAIPWPDGRLVRYEMAIDITERKQAEEETRALNRKLADSNREMEQMIYIASHDLRSPLVNIEGYSREIELQLEQMRGECSRMEKPAESLECLKSGFDELSDSLRYIRSSAAQMDALLGGLLKLSRSGRQAMNLVDLDMNEIVARVLEASEFLIEQSGAELRQNPLPPGRGDRVLVNQVFANLLHNAIKYLDPGRNGRIRISGAEEKERVVYCLEDNGLGISPAYHQKIFEIFQRLEPGRSPGEGLGLTIVRRNLERMGGSVWVESEEGRGSRFFFALPGIKKPI